MSDPTDLDQPADFDVALAARLGREADAVTVRPDVEAVFDAASRPAPDRARRGTWLAVAAAAAAVALGLVVATPTTDDVATTDTTRPLVTTATTAPPTSADAVEVGVADGPWQPAEGAWLGPRRPAETPELALEAAAVQFLGWAIEAEQVDATEWIVRDRDSGNEVPATVARRTAGWVVTRLGEAPRIQIVDGTADLRLPTNSRFEMSILWLNGPDSDEMDADPLRPSVAEGTPRPDLIVWSLDDGRVVDITMYLFQTEGEDGLVTQRFGDERLAPDRLRSTVEPVPGAAVDGRPVSRFVIDFADGSRWWLELPARFDGALGVENGLVGASMIGNGVGLTLETGQGCFNGDAAASGLLVEFVPDDVDRFRACLPEYGIRLSGELEGITAEELGLLGLVPVRLGPDTRAAIASYNTFLGSADLGPGPIGPVDFEGLTVTIDVVNGRLTARDPLDGSVVWTRVVGERRIRDLGDAGLTVVGPGPVEIDADGRRSVVFAVDTFDAAGEIVWRIETAEPFQVASIVTLGDGDIVVVEHDPSEGGTTAPQISRRDPRTGDVRWTRSFRERTDWQWAEPLLLADQVVVMDVPNEPDPLEAALWSVDLDDGELRWSVPLENSSEVFRIDMLLALADNGQVIAENVGNRTFSIDPADGSVTWAIRSDSGIRLVDEPDGQILIDQGGGIDLATGERFSLG